MKNDIFRFERKLILDAALSMAEAGVLNKSGLPEIAYFSGLTEDTVRFVYHSREEIITELDRYITDSILTKVDSVTASGDLDFEESFLLLWKTLNGYYQHNRAVAAYLRTSESADTEVIGAIKAFFILNTGRFSEEVVPDALAKLFHAGVLVDAGDHTAGNSDGSGLAGILLKGIRVSAATATDFLIVNGN